MASLAMACYDRVVAAEFPSNSEDEATAAYEAFMGKGKDEGKGDGKKGKDKGEGEEYKGKGDGKEDNGKGGGKEDKGKGDGKEDKGKGEGKEYKGKGDGKEDNGKGEGKEDKGQGKVDKELPPKSRPMPKPPSTPPPLRVLVENTGGAMASGNHRATTTLLQNMARLARSRPY